MAPNDPPSPSGGMLRILGITFGVAVAVGGTIGSGIMRTPSQIAIACHVSLIMLAWAAGAVYSLLGAWSLGGSRRDDPEFGRVLHDRAASLRRLRWLRRGMDRLGQQCGSGAAAVILAGEYARDLLPFAQPPNLTAATMAAGIALLQWRGIRWGSQFQHITSADTAWCFLV